MIFTIGNGNNYRKAMAEHGEVWKVGKREPGDERFPDGYVGGYAFLTIEDAQRRIDEAGYVHMEIFGLDADWSQTTPSERGWWHNINHDALVIFLDKRPSARVELAVFGEIAPAGAAIGPWKRRIMDLLIDAERELDEPTMEKFCEITGRVWDGMARTSVLCMFQNNLNDEGENGN